MKTKDDEYLIVKEGDILTFDVLEWWNEGYEFGRPCLMLSPVIREDSDSNPESMIEDICIDAVTQGKLLKNNEQEQIKWRQWNLKYLRRKFNEALNGKEFPIAGYCATRQKVRIIRDNKGEFVGKGELFWEEIK